MSENFIEKDHAQIVKEMLVEFAKELQTDTISNASDIAIKAKVLAAQIEGIYYNQKFILKQSNPRTATNEYLDLWGKTLNIGDRKKATKAIGNITMGRKTASEKDILIPKGTMFSTDPDIYGKLITGVTKEDVILKTGELEIIIPGETIEVGENSNIPIGAFTVLNNPPNGIEFVRNDDEFKDGSDEENDESYRSRFTREKFYGTEDAFANRAKEVDGVTFAKTLENNRGPGTTDILISTTSGIPSDELITKVLKHILEKRPLCCDLNVVKPNAYILDIQAKVYLKDGFKLESTIDGISIIERIKQSLRVYLKSIEIGGVVRKMGISDAIYSLNEIIDVEIISPTQNIQLDNNSIALEGVFHVTI